MNNTRRNHIECKGCGVPALAQMEDTPFCLHCLLVRLDATGPEDIQHQITPLQLDWPQDQSSDQSFDQPWLQVVLV